VKIQPIHRPPSAEYPSIREAQQNPELLKNVPARWEKAPGFAAMLGLLALASETRAEMEPGEGLPDAQAEMPSDPEAAKPEAEQDLKQAMTVVAPLLDEALEHDGRGSFGCVSVCPATFMPEDEALDLIRTELEAAGLHLKEGVELENVPGPIREPSSAWGNSSEVGPRPVRFDWADVDRAIYIDYLAKRDYRSWGSRSVSLNDSYDFPELAHKVSAAYAGYPADRKTIFGVFFEPLADSGVVKLDLIGLSPEQARIATQEYEKRQKATEGEKGRERLRAQVRHFVEFLRQEGVAAAGKAK
jgi:hypothetical protein